MHNTASRPLTAGSFARIRALASGPGTNSQLPGRLIFGPTRRRNTTTTLRLKRHCSRCWARTVMARVVLLVVARTQRRQRRRRRSNWAKTRQYKLFVLVRIDCSIRSQYKTITDSIQTVCIQYFHGVFTCIGLY